MWTNKSHVDACQRPSLYSPSIILMLPLFIFLHTVILGLFTNLRGQNKKKYIFANIVQPAKAATYQMPPLRLKKKIELKCMEAYFLHNYPSYFKLLLHFTGLSRCRSKSNMGWWYVFEPLTVRIVFLEWSLHITSWWLTLDLRSPKTGRWLW